MRSLVLACVAALLVGAAPAASTCRSIAPADMAGGSLTWTGPCVRGAAEGVGTLREVRRGASHVLFFGKMVRGRPFTGVMSTADGDWRPAWRFDEALRPRDDPSGNRQSSIETFRIAAAGAAEASRRYRAAGNAASARFYAEQSQRLANALD